MEETPRSYWLHWAEILRRYQMDAFAASLLLAGGPLPLLSAQALYFARPFWGGEQMTALAHTLESEDDARAFALFLNEESIR
ncbi:MAG: hypothetical protein MUO77_21105 [Anaerolineales bacterium]|nr:hypothetical protein [Anaerolineales bacterium]